MSSIMAPNAVRLSNECKKNDAWCEIYLKKKINIDKADIVKKKKMKNFIFIIGPFYRECKKTKSGAETDKVHLQVLDVFKR